MSGDDEIDWLRGMAELEEVVTNKAWKNVHRPGMLGRRRDELCLKYDTIHGIGNWRLAWVTAEGAYDFVRACKLFYEESYRRYLQSHPVDLDFICEFAECVDNSPTNIHSGLDYTAQETRATHLQDIAIRNTIAQLGRRFTGKRSELLVIRSNDSNGSRFSPGRIPFHSPGFIAQPSKRPYWAQPDSVEDFWQSNKWLQVAR